MSCRRASLLALSLALATQTGQQAAVAPVAMHWEHTLIRHERFDGFEGGSRHRAWTSGQWALILAPEYIAPLEAPLDAEQRPDDGIASFESRVLAHDSAFNDALVSWNSDCPAGTGISVELRVGRKDGGVWSPWLTVANWGTVEVSNDRAVISFAGGKIDDDYFTSTELWDRVQYRLRARCDATAQDHTVHVRRVVLCLSRRVERVASSLPAPHEHARIAVPFRSQRAEKPEIAGKICSPTSVSMVMAYRGVDRPTAEVAERIYDTTHEIYGNWPRAIQGAYSFGVPGYLARFSKWSDVEELIAAGQPLVISIAAKPGELSGAPYEKTDGHLLVLCGFDANGGVLVNDPAAADAAKGQTTYRREQLDNVWLARGGTAYVFLPKER